MNVELHVILNGLLIDLIPNVEREVCAVIPSKFKLAVGEFEYRFTELFEVVIEAGVGVSPSSARLAIGLAGRCNICY